MYAIIDCVVGLNDGLMRKMTKSVCLRCWKQMAGKSVVCLTLQWRSEIEEKKTARLNAQEAKKRAKEKTATPRTYSDDFGYNQDHEQG